MGHEASRIKPVPKNFPCFSLRLNQATLTLVHAPKHIQDAIRRTLLDNWKTGLKEDKRGPHPSLHIFKLSGKIEDDFNFWLKLEPYTLMVNVVGELRLNGYHLVTAPDLFLTIDNAEMVFYKLNKKAPENVPSQRVVGLHVGAEKELHLINAEQPLVDEIVNKLSKLTDVKEVKTHDKQCTAIMFFDKNLWSPPNDKVRVLSVRVLLALFDVLQHWGLRLEGGACLDGFVDTWFWTEPILRPLTAEGELAAVVLARDSDLWLMGMEDNEEALVEAVLKEHWHHKPCERVERFKRDVIMLTLQDNPWTATGDIQRTHNVHAKDIKQHDTESYNDNKSRSLIIHLLRALDTAGWECLCATDVSRDPDDKSIFFFRRMARKPPAPGKFIALQPSGRDMLWLLEADNESRQIFDKIFSIMLSDNVLVEQKSLHDGTESYQLAGSIWQPATKIDVFVARHVVNVAVAALLSRGWKAVCAADIMGNTRLVRMVIDEQTNRMKPARGNEISTSEALTSEMGRDECDVHMMVFKKDAA